MKKHFPMATRIKLEWNKWIYRYGKIFFFITLVAYLLAGIIQKYLLLDYHYDFTDGKIVEIYTNRVAKKILKYTYIIDGNVYVRGMIINRNLPCEESPNRCSGNYVTVQYLPFNPKISKAVLDDQ